MSPGSGSTRPLARIPVMALFLGALAFLFSPTVFAAQPTATYTRFCVSCGVRDIDTFSSQSGQFIVHGGSARILQLTPQAPLANDRGVIEIEPQLVAVTAERTRTAFAQELGVSDGFRDKIHVIVFDIAPRGQPIGIVSHLHSDGFVYKIGMPRRVESLQLLKALVQALLLEFANRDARRCAELPTWLVEGMNRQLATRVVPSSIFNSEPVTIERAGYDRLGASKIFLQTNAPLTIQQLSFPDFAQATPEQRAQFEASAHLLVHQLLRLKEGPLLMAQFIQSLPRALNWQTALFQVYREHFDSPLSLEKWWMLNCVQFRNREDRQTWSVEITLDRLESLLLTTMELRSDSDSLPQHRNATLQQVIQNAEFSAQKDLLGQKIQHLFFMSLNVPEVISHIRSGKLRALAVLDKQPAPLLPDVELTRFRGHVIL